MDESFAAKLAHSAGFLAICAGILWLGWNEPLSYRFMSATEIAEAEGGARPTPRWFDNQTRKSRLEEPPKKVGVWRPYF